VELVPYNLLQQSNNFDTTWAINGTGGGTITSGQTDPNGETNAWIFSKLGLPGRIEQVLNIGGTQTFFIYAKKNTSDFISIIIFDGSVAHQCYFNLSTGTVGTQNASTGAIESVGNGWYKCIMTSTNLISSGVIQIYISDNDGTITGTTGSVYIFNSQLNEGSTALPYQKTETRLNIPRLDYSNGTCPSLLVEPQRTNELLYSQDISNTSGSYWFDGSSGGTATATANYATSPDGTQNATRLQLNQGPLYSVWQQVIGTTSGTTYTYSIWLKAVSGTPTILFLYDGTANQNVTLTNEWMRYTFTFTGGTFAIARFGLWSSVWGTSTSADILAWGAQLEAGSYATSYIPTTSASVTRNADVISKTGISSLIGQTEGVMFVDLDWVNNGVDSVFATISDGTTSNRIHFGYAASGNFWYLYSEASGASQANITFAAPSNGKYRLAIGYKLNDYAFYVNGTQIGVDTSASVPATSQFNLGGFITTGLEHSVNYTALWKTRLTNDQLATLTTL
jgi:hypothetical protein